MNELHLLVFILDRGLQRLDGVVALADSLLLGLRRREVLLHEWQARRVQVMRQLHVRLTLVSFLLERKNTWNDLLEARAVAWMQVVVVGVLSEAQCETVLEWTLAH